MTEDKLQSECVKWFNNHYCLKHHSPRCAIFSVPNGGFRNKIEAMKLVATGMKAGVSDLILLLPNRALFIELKTDIGKQSENQKEFEQTVKALGFDYHIIRNLESFQKIISVYLQP